MQSLKDRMVEKTAGELEIDESLVDNVISWSYKKAKEAAHIHKQIELSGWGKLLVSKNKTNKRIQMLELLLERLLKKPSTKDTEHKISFTKDELEILKKRINEF